MHAVSLSRRSLETIRQDFETFDLLLAKGEFPFARDHSTFKGRRRRGRSAPLVSGLTATAAAASLLLLLAGSAF